MVIKNMEGALDFLENLNTDISSVTNAPLIPISDLQPDPHQPRKKFDPIEEENLSAGLKAEGFLQAILVRDSGGTPPYIIIDGERRWRAAQRAGINKIPCYVRNDIEPAKLRFAQAMANANRQDLSDYELAVVIKEALDNNPRLKKKDVAAQLGKDPAVVSRLLGLLDEQYVDLAARGLIEGSATLSHFKSLDSDTQALLLEGARQGQVITREKVDQIRMMKATGPHTSKNSITRPKVKTNNNKKLLTSIHLKLDIETIKRLAPLFRSDRQFNIHLEVSVDEAAHLIKSLGLEVPENVGDYEQTIKDALLRH